MNDVSISNLKNNTKSKSESLQAEASIFTDTYVIHNAKTCNGFFILNTGGQL